MRDRRQLLGAFLFLLAAVSMVSLGGIVSPTNSRAADAGGGLAVYLPGISFGQGSSQSNAQAIPPGAIPIQGGGYFLACEGYTPPDGGRTDGVTVVWDAKAGQLSFQKPPGSAPIAPMTVPPCTQPAPPTPTPTQTTPGIVAPIGPYTCPASHPIKLNADSGIYHLPGQEFYDVTKPEGCARTEADAQAAGYRRRKV